MGDDLETEPSAVPPGPRCDAPPVELAVVYQRHLAAATLAKRGGERAGLDPVVGCETEVMAEPLREVLLRLAGVGARAGARQADRAVRRADLRDPRQVENRHRDGARARVELADVGDRRLILRRTTSIARGPLGRPGTGAAGGVVQGHVSDRPAA